MAREALVSDLRDERLTTWKEIAAFLGRDERTAKRWEATRGLPVRRMPGGRSTVYALRRDLENWLAHAPSEDVHEAARETPPAGPAEGRPPRLLFGLGLAAATFALVGGLWVAGREKPSHAEGAPALYTQGLYLMNTRTRAGLEGAIEDFSKLALHEPDYAPAYAGLASSYNLMPEFGGMAPAQAFAEARVAAEKAVALEPDLAEGQRALGFALFWGVHDVEGARRAFEAAVRLDPSDPTAQHWYANVLTMLGDEPGALARFARAEALDSASTALRADHANALRIFGHLEEARASLAAIVAAQPRYGPAWGYLALVERMRGDSGDEASALEHLSPIEGSAAAPRSTAYGLAESLAPTDPDRAFALLAGLERSGDPEIMAVRCDPFLRPLHRDQRFARLLGRLNLPPLGGTA